MNRVSLACAAVCGSMLSVAAGTAAQASDGNCSGAGVTDTLSVARVAKGRGKVGFVRNRADDASCPSLAATCRERAYLVAGDVVVTAERQGEFVCATYADAKGRETSGWLPASSLEPLQQGAPLPLAGWQGTWRRTEASIRIAPAAGGTLSVSGNATWGGMDPRRVASGAVNMGELSGRAKPVGDVLSIADGKAASFETASKTTCAVRMRRIARYLLVEDNNACGGANVSFSGVYVRG